MFLVTDLSLDSREIIVLFNLVLADSMNWWTLELLCRDTMTWINFGSWSLLGNRKRSLLDLILWNESHFIIVLKHGVIKITKNNFILYFMHSLLAYFCVIQILVWNFILMMKYNAGCFKITYCGATDISIIKSLYSWHLFKIKYYKTFISFCFFLYRESFLELSTNYIWSMFCTTSNTYKSILG